MLHVSDFFFPSEPAVVQMLCSAVCKQLKTRASEEKKRADRGGCGGKDGEPAMRGKESLWKTKAALARYLPRVWGDWHQLAAPPFDSHTSCSTGRGRRERPDLGRGGRAVKGSVCLGSSRCKSACSLAGKLFPPFLSAPQGNARPHRSLRVWRPAAVGEGPHGLRSGFDAAGGKGGESSRLPPRDLLRLLGSVSGASAAGAGLPQAEGAPQLREGSCRAASVEAGGGRFLARFRHRARREGALAPGAERGPRARAHLRGNPRP